MKAGDDMEEREYFVEEAKNQRIVFKGTKDECEEWCNEYIKEYQDRILIIRKGQKNVNNGSSI